MRKSPIIVLCKLLLLLVFCGCGGGGGGGATAGDGVTLPAAHTLYYPSDVGYSWTNDFVNGTSLNPLVSTVVSASSTGFSVKKQDNADEHTVTEYVYDGSALKVSAATSYYQGKFQTKFTFSPPYPVLPSNLSAGYGESTTSVRTQSTEVYGDTTGTLQTDIFVNGEESVSTPAGTFTAVKLTVTSTFNGIAFTAFQWYVKGVGLVKQTSWDGMYMYSQQLRSYSSPSIQPPSDIVTIFPPSALVISGGNKRFTAVVPGASNGSVTWSVVEAGGGAISTGGYYTAPSSPGTYHIKATSVADPTKNATAAITVATTYAVSGKVTAGGVPLAGVEIFDDNCTKASTDASGNYSMPGHVTGTWTIMPKKTGYSFSPSTLTATVNGADVKGVNFTATPNPTPYSISGNISSGGVPLPGVTVSCGGGSAITDASGNYTINHLSNGRYTLSPAKTGYAFTPATLAATINGININGKNFTFVKTTSADIAVTITPASASVSTGATKAFTASVTGSGNTAVTWSVVEPAGGRISSSGVYTAPATAGTYHVKAVSTADTSKSATATVTVTGSSTTKPGNFPIGTWVGPYGASFTITRLDHKGIGLQYYAGSITFPRGAGTVNVSGKEPPADTSLIGLGANLGVGASIITSTSGTFYNFISADVSDADAGNPDITSIEGTMIMTTVSGDNIDERAIFTKQ